MNRAALHEQSEAYLDRLFGPGMGRRHRAFLDGIGHSDLADSLHAYHVLEGDEALLSVQENYLIGLCVLCAQGRWGPAGMFARTLAHLGTDPAKVLEAVRRLEMWVGGLHAAEAVGRIARALADYEARGLDSMAAWFPEADDG